VITNKLMENSGEHTNLSNSSQENKGFFSLFTQFDTDLFKAGKHYRLYEKLGAHVVEHNGGHGVYFAVWAPNATQVSLTGNFNGWNRQSHTMQLRWDGSGIWELFVEGLGRGDYYKYYIVSQNGHTAEKADPYGVHCETPPATASIVWDTCFNWTDEAWLKKRSAGAAIREPLAVYELHMGSWRRKEDNSFLSYKELAEQLPAYCSYMHYTHVELMPVMQHPFYGSWGYQLTGYFAPDSRYGTPQDFMQLVDALHRAGIGVILDWVPSHFPTDEHGLGYFDGTHLYEHADPRRGFHPDWQSYVFNYGRNEVRAFLISNALYWLGVYHIDGLRVDAVASMLYLDYSRKEGEWLPNASGGRENLEAVQFLREFNDAVHTYYSPALTIAEESTAWPGVTHTTADGGLGFDLKWMMGWMHDTLYYFQKDPLFRGFHQQLLSFSIYYNYSEKFMLPLSHDEVVYGKRSLIEKMPGDDWQKFANLRLLYSYMYGHPGAKLLFMGGEFAQRHEWRHDFSLDWHENDAPAHHGIQQLVKELNTLYKNEKALYEKNFSPEGFEWIDFNDSQNSVLCWLRIGENPDNTLLIVANFTPAPHNNYRVGSPAKGCYHLIFNSDAAAFGGSGYPVNEQPETSPIHKHGRAHSLSLHLPPLSVLILKKAATV
jgi:1,4-alpha-glucan branching enzyme